MGMAKTIFGAIIVIIVVSAVFIVTNTLIFKSVYDIEIEDISLFDNVEYGRSSRHGVKFESRSPKRYLLSKQDYSLKIVHEDNLLPGLQFFAKNTDSKLNVSGVMIEGPSCLSVGTAPIMNEGDVFILTYRSCAGVNSNDKAKVKIIISDDSKQLGSEVFDLRIQRNGIYLVLDMI